MEDLFGELLVKLIPFLIPALLVTSFLANTKSPKVGRKDSGTENVKQSPAKKEEKAQPGSQQMEALSDKDMAE